jgi:single-stranded DNA-binding protein
MTDINKVLITGTIGEPRIGWLESGKPELRLSLTVAQEGGFQLYVQVYCYGKDVERLAETLEAGDRVLIDGKLSWRSTVKAGVKESRMVVVCYGVERLASSPVDARSGAGEGDPLAPTAIAPPGDDGRLNIFKPLPAKVRRRGYPKSALSGGFHP